MQAAQGWPLWLCMEEWAIQGTREVPAAQETREVQVAQGWPPWPCMEEG